MKARLPAGRNRAAVPASAMLLFAVNAWVCSRLWGAGFIDQIGSSEGPQLALSRFILNHWGNLLWFAQWFCGLPFLQAYQPGLSATVAAIAAVFSLPPERAYHGMVALFYSLGPVTLFWLCYHLTSSRTYGFLTGLLYSLFSTSALLSAPVRNDMDGWLHARRYQVLVHYGEGPHIVALTLIPLAIWALDRAIAGGRRLFIPIAAFLIGAIVVTSWTGTVGLAMAVVAYFVSQFGTVRPARWGVGLGIAALGYLLVCPWVPPSILALVPANAQRSVGVYFAARQLGWAAALVLLLLGFHFALKQWGVRRGLGFFIYFFLVTGVIVLPGYWAGAAVLPQAARFHLEMELALAALLMYPVALAARRASRPLQAGLAVLLAVLSILQFRGVHRYARDLTRPVQIENRIEYREAKWFEHNLPGARVFAPGSVAVWMNAFTDSPQMAGCCDQGVPSLEHRIAFYTVYAATGKRGAEASLLWLKAYGARAIGVSGPRSSETFKAYSDPRKFEGVLPVLWRDEDDVIYQVSRGPYSLAHVIRREQEVQRPPAHGLDLEPLRPFVGALEDPSLPAARFAWRNPREADIETEMRPGQVLSLQVSYAPGWHASADGGPARVRRDALGLMVVETRCNGRCRVALTYDGGAEGLWTRTAQWVGILLCVAWPLAARRRDSGMA